MSDWTDEEVCLCVPVVDLLCPHLFHLHKPLAIAYVSDLCFLPLFLQFKQLLGYDKALGHSRHTPTPSNFKVVECLCVCG